MISLRELVKRFWAAEDKKAFLRALSSAEVHRLHEHFAIEDKGRKNRFG